MDFLNQRRQHWAHGHLPFVNRMNQFFRMLSVLVVAQIPGAVALAAPAPTASAPAPRERLLLDFGWRFHLGNDWGTGQNLAKSGSSIGPASVVFSDASWRRVDLPHDWAVELPFDQHADGSHGFKALGGAFPRNSVAWYRRTFTLPATDAGRRLWLELDGAYRDATVFVNGWFVGRNESGYSGFRYDITDVAEPGRRNVIAVRVDATENEGWFYEGAGIYRHTWLVETGPLAIAPDGIFVRGTFKNNAPGGPAKVLIETRVANAAAVAAGAEIVWTILGPDGKSVATTRRPARVAAAATADVIGSATVAAPVLWSPESPRLYQLVTTVEVGGRAVDRVTTAFGLRTFAFDAKRGFLLNGRPYVIRGTCNHQDHAGVGVALPDRLQAFRLERLKEMGSNAYRSAHNPPTPELLDAADRVGLLVMDESRLLGSDAANLDRLERLVRRDRNHASVAIWSLANEEFATQGTPSGKRTAATMQALIKRLDPTRPVTYNSTAGNDRAGINEVIEVRGWSYRIGVDRMDAYHAAHPEQPNVGSEQGSTMTARGVYASDAARCTMSAYDDNQAEWSNTAKQWAGFFAPRPWLSGGFVWSGFDYRGEPTIHQWPCISTPFGVLDTAGFPKDNFWLYQSWWTERPMVHLLPHWNWPGREGQEIDVRAYSNAEEVELLLNGQSLGRQTLAPFSELKWKVKYAPGTLVARAFRGGSVVAETRVETTGAPAAVRATADRTELRADGEDVAVVTVAVVDAQGRVVPTASVPVAFTLAGAGRILGVGNGDPASHEPDVFVGSMSTRARAIDGWRWKKIADPYAETIAEAAPGFDDSGWQATDVRRASGPLGLNERGLLRATFTVTDADLAAHAIELWFRKIEGDGRVFLNGKLVGPAGDSRAASVYDVKALLQRGPNTVAVALANYGGAAGVNQGVELRLYDQTPPPAWSRRTFNGLAQIIIQTTKQPGVLELGARAAGLAPATLVLPATPATPRPGVD
jgi:beta-galactosidase